MDEKYQKYVVGIGLTIMVAGSFDHDRIDPGLVQVINICEDHAPEEPFYQNTQTNYLTTQVTSGSTTTTTAP